MLSVHQLERVVPVVTRDVRPVMSTASVSREDQALPTNATCVTDRELMPMGVVLKLPWVRAAAESGYLRVHVIALVTWMRAVGVAKLVPVVATTFVAVQQQQTVLECVGEDLSTGTTTMTASFHFSFCVRL